MAFGLGTTLNTGNSVLTGALTALGVNGWQLKNGMYNGCTFVAFAQIPIVDNNAIVQNGENLVASVNEISGLTESADPNAVGNLFSTFLGMLQFSDKIHFNVAIKDLPFANRCNTENMGVGGYTFKMVLLFLGPDYQKAMRNFENAILYPPTDPSLANSLVHPTRGLITGITRVIDYEPNTNLSFWNAATISITFRSEQVQKGQSTSSQIQNFGNAISAGLGVAGGLLSTAATFQSIVNSNGRIPTGQTSNVTYTKSSAVVNSTTDLSNTMVANINYVYQTSNTSVVNATLNAQTINYNLLPPSLNQVVEYAPIQGDIIMNYYSTKAASLISLIEEGGFGVNGNDLINQINNSITSLQKITTLASPTLNSLAYIVPYPMSLRTVLSKNSISLSNAQFIYNNNPQLLSPNYIAEGTTVYL